MNCKYCGSEDVEYVGMDDGGGDYGTAVCQDWFCNDCGQNFETNCVEIGEPEYDSHAAMVNGILDEIIAEEDSDDLGEIPF